MFTNSTPMTTKKRPVRSRETWEQSVVSVLQALGPAMHLTDLYIATKGWRLEHGLPLSNSFTATIRRVCQQSPRIVQDRERYRSGMWRLAGPDDVEPEVAA